MVVRSARLTILGVARRRAASWCWWLPVILAGCYGLVILVHLPEWLVTFYRDSDAATPTVLAQLLGSAPAGASTSVGNHPYYEELGFLLLTRGLPIHRQVWYIAPLVFSLFGLGLFAWTARRIFGPWPAALAAGLLLCFGELGLYALFTYGTRGNSAIHAIVLVGTLVWLIPRVLELSLLRLLFAAVALGLFSALPTAGDALFVFWGLIPLVVSTVTIGWRGPAHALWRTVGFGLLTTAVALAGGAVYSHVMSASGVHGWQPGLKSFLVFATPAGLARNLGVFLEGFTSLSGGDFFGQPASAYLTVAAFASGALLLAAFGLVLLDIGQRARQAVPRAAGGGEPSTARDAYVIFWSTCLVGGSAAFLLGSPGSSASAGRYLLGPYVSIAALLPLLLLRGLGWKLIITATACVFALAASYRALRVPVSAGEAPGAGVTAALTQFADQQRVDHGYSFYWDAIDLSWASHLRLKIYPVSACSAAPAPLCPFAAVQISSWYSPRPSVRTMLLVDPTWPAVNTSHSELGPPVATTVIGHITAYVYSYDIAERFGHG